MFLVSLPAIRLNHERNYDQDETNESKVRRVRDGLDVDLEEEQVRNFVDFLRDFNHLMRIEEAYQGEEYQ